MAKLLSELDVVRRNIDIMSEVMTQNEPGKESEDDVQLMEVRVGGVEGGWEEWREGGRGEGRGGGRVGGVEMWVGGVEGGNGRKTLQWYYPCRS